MNQNPSRYTVSRWRRPSPGSELEDGCSFEHVDMEGFRGALSMLSIL